MNKQIKSVISFSKLPDRFLSSGILVVVFLSVLAAKPVTLLSQQVGVSAEQSYAIESTPTLADETQPEVDSDLLNSLLEQLDSDQFVQRQEAMHQLWLLGPEATAIRLYQLQQNGSLESRKRAEALLHRFRIGLVPGMDFELAQLISNFENGNKEQKKRCINRLMFSGNLSSAMALWRSDNRSYAMEDSAVYLQHWLRHGQWQAIDDFYRDVEIAMLDLPSTIRYYQVTGQTAKQRDELNFQLETDVDEAEKSFGGASDTQALTVGAILGGPQFSREETLKLSACLEYFAGDYQQSLLFLQQMEGSQTELFRLYFFLCQYEQAAQAVSQLQSSTNRQFVLPEEGVARQYCEALLNGWSGDRHTMKAELSKQEPTTEQLFTYACALLASGDPELAQKVLARLKLQDKGSLFELYCDMERWDLAFAELEYPVSGSDQDRKQWIATQLEPMRKRPQEFRRSSERATLISLAETLSTLGLPDQAIQILEQLSSLPDESDMQLDYSKIQLCRRAIAAGLYDWAIEKCIELRPKFADEDIVTIWFAGDNEALFWYRLLFDEAMCQQLDLDLPAGDTPEGFRSRIALMGRLLRETGLQSLEPQRFYDLAEVRKFDRLAQQTVDIQNSMKSSAFNAIFRLRWDYSLYDDLVLLESNPWDVELSLEQTWLLAIGLWQKGEFKAARLRFWQIYWDDSQLREAMLCASLPEGFDLFQFVADQPVARDQQELLAAIKPWNLSAEEIAEGKRLMKLRAEQSQKDGTIDWANVSDREILLTARLHYDICRVKEDGWMRSALEFQRLGCDRLAAWQTLEYQVRSVWFKFRESSWASASLMLSFLPNAGWKLQKHWQAEMVTSALLSYPVGKAGTYASIGAAIRASELQGVLQQNDLEQATEIAGQIQQHHPFDIEVVEYLTNYLDRFDLHSEADKVFEVSFTNLANVQQKYPNSSLLANNLAWMCVQGSRKLDIAEQLVSRAMQLEPGTPNYPDTLADVLWKQGRNEEAKAMNQLSRRLAPTRSYYRRQTQKFDRPYSAASIR